MKRFNLSLIGLGVLLSFGASPSAAQFGDAAIEFTNCPDTVKEGAPITYNLMALVLNQQLAGGVTVTDTLPGGLSNVTATATNHADHSPEPLCDNVSFCTVSNGVVTCKLPDTCMDDDKDPDDVPVSEDYMPMTINATAPMVAGPITVFAHAQPINPDPNPLNNDASCTTMVTAPGAPGEADLSITKVADPSMVEVGSTVTFTLTVSNAGLDVATNTIVTDNLPSQLSLVSANTSVGTCNSNNAVTCNLGNMANGASATITIVAKALTVGSVTNTATVASNSPDNTLADNTASATIQIINAGADLFIEKTADQSIVPVGTNLTYTLFVSNFGPDAAAAPVVTDVLSPSVTLVSASVQTAPGGVTMGSCSGTSTVTCTLNDLPSGHNATITIVVKPTVAGSLSNTGTIASTTPDPVPANNTSTVVVTVSNNGNPVPVLTSLVPNSTPAGGPSFFLTLNGSNFINTSVVQWNGSNRATNFINGNQLTADISAVDIASAGTASVTVVNPGPGGGTSNALPFAITTQGPPSTSIQFNPTTYSVMEGTGSAVITVTRTGDTSGNSTVQFASADGTAKAGVDYTSVTGTLTFNPGDTTKTFDVPILNDGVADGPETVNLSLSNPTGANLGASQAQLTITDQNPAPPPPPAPFISALVPFSAPVNFSSTFPMRVLGSGFDATNAQVIWNSNTTLPVVSRSTSEIDVTVDPLIWNNTAGSYPVIVRNPGPADSNQAMFTVRSLGSGNPPPFLVSGPNANPNPTYTKTTTLTAMGGTLSPGGESVLTYTWSVVGSGNPSLNVSFSNNGTHAGSTSVATFPAAGTYHIRVRVLDTVTQFAVDSVTIDVVVIRNATSISVTPKDQTVSINMPLNLTASITDQWGAAINNLTPNWSTSAGSLAPSGQTASFSDSDASIRQAVVTASVVNALGNPLSDAAKVTIVIGGAGSGGDLTNAKAYPVPFKGNSGDPFIHFKNLVPGTRIRIFTITGRIVQTLSSADGSDIDWNVTNANLDKLASGVYLYIMESASQKKEGKLVIIQ